MTRFKLTAKQKKFIEMAERRFDARLAQPKRKSCAFSRYFLEKCSNEQGIEPPHKPRGHSLQHKMFRALEKTFGQDNWLIQMLRRR